jgi:hypothetical protein
MFGNPKRRLAAAGVAVVVALGGAGSALACDHDGDSHGVMAAKFAVGHDGWHHRSLLSLPSAYLGVSKDAIKAQLASGKTLAQIADATPGKSAAGLVDYVAAAAKTKLDTWVASGKLSQADENAWLAKLRTKLTAAINATWAVHH